MALTTRRRGKPTSNSGAVENDDSSALGEVLHRSTKTTKPSKKSKNADKLLKIDIINNPDSDVEINAQTPCENRVIYKSKCSCESHFGKVFIDCKYNITADKIFDLLFGMNEFVRTYRQAQRIYDDKSTEWSPSEDTDCEERLLTYKVPYESTFVGKGTILAREKQKMLKKQPGFHYLIEIEVCNSGVKYSDTFSLNIRYCILQTSATTSHILITGQIRFCKSVNGFIKQLIERNAFSASHESFKDLNNRLHLISNFKREKRLLNRDGISLPVPTLNNSRARRMSRHDALGISLSDQLANDNKNNQMATLFSHFNPFVCFLLFVTIFLLLIQIYLYTKLQYMEVLIDGLSNVLKTSTPSIAKRRA